MIYLVRHGIDDESIIGGWSDAELTKEGRNQMKEVALYIKSNNIKIDYILHSDIKRATQSAEILSKQLKLPLKNSSLFRELNKGDLTGLKISTALKRYPQYCQKLDIETKFPNGESMLEFYNRIKKDVLPIVLKEKNVLIVTHRGVINMLYFLINQIPLTNDKKIFNVDHASVHKYNNEKKKIERIF